MKEKSSGMILKLIAAAVFIGGIGGGGFLAYSGVSGDTENWQQFAIGLCIVICSVFVVACIVPWIAHLDGRADWEAEEGKTTVLTSIKTGLLFSFLAALLIFIFIGIVFWLSRGIWQLGAAAAAALFVLIVTSFEMSIRFQTRHSRKVLKSKNAEERIGKITSVRGQFPILFFGRKNFFVKVYVVETDGAKSEAFLRASNKLAKRLCTGAEVKVKINPEHPRYCAICQAVFSEDF